VQLVALKVPVLFEANVTVPVGMTAPVPEESATVAVQVVATLSRTLAGLHEIVVVLARIVEASVKVPLLPLCDESPP
jgi:hypothetical protein